MAVLAAAFLIIGSLGLGFMVFSGVEHTAIISDPQSTTSSKATTNIPSTSSVGDSLDLHSDDCEDCENWSCLEDIYDELSGLYNESYLTEIQQLLEDFIQNGIIQDIITYLKDLFYNETRWQDLLNAIDSAIQNFRNVSFFTAIQEAVMEYIDGFEEFPDFEEIMESIKEWFSYLGDGTILEYIMGLIEEILGYLPEVPRAQE